MPHVDKEPQRFIKSAKDKSMHRQAKVVEKKEKVAGAKKQMTSDGYMAGGKC